MQALCNCKEDKTRIAFFVQDLQPDHKHEPQSYITILNIFKTLWRQTRSVASKSSLSYFNSILGKPVRIECSWQGRNTKIWVRRSRFLKIWLGFRRRGMMTQMLLVKLLKIYGVPQVETTVQWKRSKNSCLNHSRYFPGMVFEPAQILMKLPLVCSTKFVRNAWVTQLALVMVSSTRWVPKSFKAWANQTICTYLRPCSLGLEIGQTTWLLSLPSHQNLLWRIFINKPMTSKLTCGEKEIINRVKICMDWRSSRTQILRLGTAWTWVRISAKKLLRMRWMTTSGKMLLLILSLQD